MTLYGLERNGVAIGASSPVALRSSNGLQPGPNLLSASESYLFSTWTKDHGTAPSIDPVVTDNAVVGPLGAMDASSGDFNRGTGSFSRIQIAPSATNGRTYRFDVWLAAPSSGLNISLRAISTNGPALTLTTAWQYFAVDTVAAGGQVSAQLLLFSSITNSPATATAYMWRARVYLV